MMITFFETILIMAVDFLVRCNICYILLLLASGYSNSDKNMGFRIITVVAIVVFIYRLPLFVMAYFTNIVNKSRAGMG